LNKSSIDGKSYIKGLISNEPIVKVFDIMNMGILLLAHDYTIIYVNDALCRIFSATKEMLLNKNILDLFQKQEQRELAENILSMRKEGISSRYEFKVTNLDGEDIHLLGSGTPIFDTDSRFVGTLAFYIDITERKKIEKELEKLKHFSENIVENIPSGIVVVDESLNLLLANRTFLDFLSLSEHEVVGKKITDVMPFESLREKSFLKHVLDVLSNGGMRTIEDIPLKIDSRNYIFSARIKKLPPEEKEPERVLIILDDMTAVRELQKQLIHIQRMDSIGKLAGGIAHDFNNLLGGILGYASVLVHELPEESDARKSIEMILKSAEKASDLTRQLLTFSSSKEARVEIFDPARLIEDVVKLLSRTVDRKINIETSIDPETPHILGNETNFEQALLNICINARDAMPDGGTLKIQAGPEEIDVEYCNHHIDARPGRYTKVTVSDTGVGIDPDIKHRIFEPFFTTKKGKDKAGLGLSIVYGTVKSMNGFIDIQSYPGSGTSFSIFIPAQVEKEKGKGEQPAVDSYRGTETLLVVDDEEIMIDLSKKILSSQGYKVIPAENGEKALEVLKEHSEEIKMIILDLIMPGMSGYETFKAIRKEHPDMPIIISTGYSPGGSAAEILKEPLTEFLQKPFYMKDMLSKVRALLDSSKKS